MNPSKDEVKEIWGRGDYRSRGQFFPPVSADLTRLVKLQAEESVLDVACGYGNTAITAQMKGAKVTGIDITPKHIALAKEEEKIAGTSGIDWKEGDAEDLPFEDESFDVVLSTFGHIFAPNQELAGKEMLRVLKKSGRLGFTSGLLNWLSENYPKLFLDITRFKLLTHFHLIIGAILRKSNNFYQVLKIFSLKEILSIFQF